MCSTVRFYGLSISFVRWNLFDVLRCNLPRADTITRVHHQGLDHRISDIYGSKILKPSFVFIVCTLAENIPESWVFPVGSFLRVCLIGSVGRGG